jgi:hypothetical protein
VIVNPNYTAVYPVRDSQYYPDFDSAYTAVSSRRVYNPVICVVGNGDDQAVEANLTKYENVVIISGLTSTGDDSFVKFEFDNDFELTRQDTRNIIFTSEKVELISCEVYSSNLIFQSDNPNLNQEITTNQCIFLGNNVIYSLTVLTQGFNAFSSRTVFIDSIFSTVLNVEPLFVVIDIVYIETLVITSKSDKLSDPIQLFHTDLIGNTSIIYSFSGTAVIELGGRMYARSSVGYRLANIELDQFTGEELLFILALTLTMNNLNDPDFADSIQRSNGLLSMIYAAQSSRSSKIPAKLKSQLKSYKQLVPLPAKELIKITVGEQDRDYATIINLAQIRNSEISVFGDGPTLDLTNSNLLEASDLVTRGIVVGAGPEGLPILTQRANLKICDGNDNQQLYNGNVDGLTLDTRGLRVGFQFAFGQDDTPIDFRSDFGRVIYIDASQDDALVLLPANNPNRSGLIFTLKRVDTTNHKVIIRSEDGTLIDGQRFITIKPKCKQCRHGHPIKKLPADPVQLQLAADAYWIV